MPTITMPSNTGFVKVGWGLVGNTQAFESPLTKSIQTFNLTGARWVGTWQLPPLKLVKSAEWMAFFTQLEGRAGRFYGSPPNKNPQGLAGGTPLVKGASQTGTSLITDGWPASTAILTAGDYIELANGELKMVTATVSSDSSGNATLSIRPALRDSPADNSAITTANVKCTMMLSADDQGRWERDRLNLYGITFSGVEVWES